MNAFRVFPFMGAGIFLLWSDICLAAGDLKSTAQTTLQKSQKAIVPIKLVIKIKMSKEDQEHKTEITGTVIDPSGLTVVSAAAIDPAGTIKSLLGSMLKGRGSSQFQFDSDVTETTIILDDGTEVEADVVLKDPDLDLAFIRPRSTSRTFDAITLKPRSTPPQILEDVFAISRLGTSENRAPAVSVGMIRAVVKGPRTFYICDDKISNESLGCIAFAADGTPIGIFVTKKSQGAPGQGGLAGLSRSLSGGGAGGTPMIPIAILRPVEDILEVAVQAKQAKLPEKKVEPPASDGVSITPVGGPAGAATSPPPANKPPAQPAKP